MLGACSEHDPGKVAGSASCSEHAPSKLRARYDGMIGGMLEAGEVRKRLRQTIEAARRDAVARRAALASEQQAFDAFLENHAVPVLRQVASALKAEGHVFQVLTPAGIASHLDDRFDLLGNSLAILTGIASPDRARKLVAWELLSTPSSR